MYALGFAAVFSAPAGPREHPPLVHLRRRKYQDVLLVPGGPDPSGPRAAGLTLSFDADGEVDAMAERARSAAPLGASAIEGPLSTPWNTRELRVSDPAGHRLVFFERDRNPDPARVASMKAMLEAGRPG